MDRFELSWNVEHLHQIIQRFHGHEISEENQQAESTETGGEDDEIIEERGYVENVVTDATTAYNGFKLF